MAEKSIDSNVSVVVGDILNLPDSFGSFPLIYATYGVIYCFLSQAEQVSCFGVAGRLLTPGGRFVVDGSSPVAGGVFSQHQALTIRDIGDDRIDISGTRVDPVKQIIEFQEISLKDGRISLLPITMRYIWPSEMDLMAQMAGLELEHRFGGWNRERFTRQSPVNVSVYRLPESPSYPGP
jgi:SAM-dependent methyltransferase